MHRTGRDLSRGREIRALRGPSVWSPRPVAACEVVPGRKLGRGPTPYPALFEQLLSSVAAELQARAGAPVPFCRALPPGADGTAAMAVGYEEESLGLESVLAAVAAAHAQGTAPETIREGLRSFADASVRSWPR